MNLLNTKTKATTIRACINFMESTFGFSLKWALFCITFFGHVQVKAWEIDFSRRTKELQTLRLPASIVDQVPKSARKTPVAITAERDIVVMQTENGFVPQIINLKVGESYTFHIVNVNSKAKNASFMLDGFSENHATYFGTTRTFEIKPKVTGKFKFQSPEPGYFGEINVDGDVASEDIPSSRIPAQSSIPFPKD